MDNFIGNAKAISILLGVMILFIVFVVFPVIDMLDPKAHLLKDLKPFVSVLASLIGNSNPI